MDRSELVKKIGALPPIPYVAHEILLMLNDDEASFSTIAETLAKEPGLTAKLVAMANSAFYARQNKVYSVEDAVMRLGLARVRGIAVSILLADQFDPDNCVGFKQDVYWHDAVSVAFCASRLSNLGKIELGPEAMYLSGLIHNIGLLVLAYLFPQETSLCLQEKDHNPQTSLTELAQANFGFDHHEAGLMLLEQWKMPHEVAQVIGHYHQPEHAGEYEKSAAMLGFSKRWVSADFANDAVDPEKVNLKVEHLVKIASACEREAEQIEHFSQLLSGAA